VALLEVQATGRAAHQRSGRGERKCERWTTEPACGSAQACAATALGEELVLETAVAHRQSPAAGLAASVDERHRTSLRLAADGRQDQSLVSSV
jgi:hypothetical protein